MSSNELLQSLEFLKQEVNDIDTFITKIPTRENLTRENLTRKNLIDRNEMFYKRVVSLVDNLVVNSLNHKSRSDLLVRINKLDSYFDIIFRSIQDILKYILPSNSYKDTLEENLKNIREEIPKIEWAITLYDKPSDKKTDHQIENEHAGTLREADEATYYAEQAKKISDQQVSGMLSGNSGGGRRIKKRTRRHKKKRGKNTRGKRTRKL